MKAKITSIFFLIVLSLSGYAQLIDEQFRPLIATSATISAIAVQPDGKVIAGGDIVLAGDKPVNHLVRLNSDGSLDESFTAPTFIDEYASIQTILVDHAGKIIVGGRFSNGTYAVRLHANGSLDESFTLPPDIEDIIKIDLYHSNRYIVLSFSFHKHLVVLNNDGTVDPSFNAGTGPNSLGIDGTDFTVLPDGDVIFVGTFSRFNDVDHNRVVRLSRDGSIDEAFDIGAGPQGSTPYINSAKVQSDGKILLAGKFESFNNFNAVNLVRLHPDGSVDEGFTIPAPSANFFSFEIGAMTLAGDDIFLAGLKQDIGNGELHYSVLKLNPDGSLATDFNAALSDISAENAIHDPLLANGPNGIILSGNFSRMGGDDRRGLALLNRTTGQLDADFNPPLGGLPKIRTVRQDAEGNFFIGGRFHFVNGVRVQNLAKLRPDGSLDEAFAVNTGAGPDHTVNCIELDADGRVLVAGGMSRFNNSNTGNLFRLKTDGTLDDTFVGNVYTGSVGSGVNVLRVLPDGKLMIGGYFDHINGQPMKALARLESDGNTDATFHPTVFDDRQVVNAIAIVDGNNLLIGGNRRGGTSGGFLHHIDATGSIVNDFPNVDLSNQSILTITVLPSGGFLAAGTFSKIFSDSAPNALLQFNSEGTLVDRVSIAAYQGAIQDIMLMPDDYVMLAGSFRKVNTVSSSGLSIIKLTGQMTDVYQFDIDGYTTAAYQSNAPAAPLILCGTFSGVNGISNFGIAKVNMAVPAVATDLAYEIDNAEGEISVSWTDRAFNETGYQILREAEGITTIIDTVAANITSYVDVTAEPAKTYSYRIRGFNQEEKSRDSEGVTISTSRWVPPAPPANPTHHIADNFTSVDIAWTDGSDNEKGFELERALGDGAFSQIDITGPDVTVFTDDFSFNIHHQYRIRSYNKFGKSEYTPIVELPVILDVYDPESTALSVYPNPANDVVRVDHNFQSPVRIILRDMTGKTLRDQSHEGGVITLDLYGIPPGFYLIRVQGENKSKTMKVHKL